jgi:hypothetical protein
MIKAWTLVLYILSSGIYEEKHISAVDCNDALLEAYLVKGSELWSAVCVGPDDEVTAQISRELGP